MGANSLYDPAYVILGDDFISPLEITNARGTIYGEGILRRLVATLPSEKDLLWLRDNGFMLMAGPPEPLSLLEIRSLENRLFEVRWGGWFSDEKYEFSRNEKIPAEWLMLRKNVVPNSFKEGWKRQAELLLEVEYIPNIAELTWGITTYKKIRYDWLFSGIYARTSSVSYKETYRGNTFVHSVYTGSAPDGTIGLFYVTNLGISNDWSGIKIYTERNDRPDGRIGLASARKR